MGKVQLPLAGLNLWDDLLLEIGNTIINDDDDDDETVLEDPTTPQ
jgi:hypothetical protein